MHVIFEGSNEKLMQHISIILSIFDSEDFEKIQVHVSKVKCCYATTASWNGAQFNLITSMQPKTSLTKLI